MPIDVIDISTAAAELCIGQSTLRRWLAEGKLPGIRLGRRVLIRRAAIEAFLNGLPHALPKESPNGSNTRPI